VSTSKPARGGHGPRRAKRITALALSLGIIAATSLPVALAVPASATITKDGCSVTPLRPVYKAAVPRSEAKVEYRVRVRCDAGRSVVIWHERYEEDPSPNPDDYLGSHAWALIYVLSGTQVVSIETAAPDTESTSEEAYHRVKFQVTPFFGEAGNKKPWEKSPVEVNIG
jgi:hypothetical protein